LTPILIFIFKDYVGRFYSVIEERFLKNLNAKDIAELETLAKLPQLAPWNATLAQIVLTSDSRLAGQTIEDCKFRTETGATIVMIDRGSRRIFAPGRSERLLPGDELFLIGTDEQTAAARELAHPKEEHVSLPHDELYSLETVTIEDGSAYAEKSIREIGFGEQFAGLVVGIEREGKRILNPESLFVLHTGDLVWIFGHKTKIRDIKRLGAASRPARP
jgi:CPA2 family monovalent cation:H+ antiporter-2